MSPTAIGVSLMLAGAAAATIGMIAIVDGDGNGGHPPVAVVTSIPDHATTTVALATTTEAAPTTASTVATTATPTTTSTTSPAPTSTTIAAATTSVASTTSQTAPPEAADAFISALQDAIRTNDAPTLESRLDPAVLDRYAPESCREYFLALTSPSIVLALVDVLPPAPWRWETDGLVREIPDALTLKTRRSDDGGTTFVDVEVHVTRAETGALQWFTDCGTPKEQAR